MAVGSTYTAPPPAQQFIASANQTLNSGQTLSAPAVQQAQQGYAGANQEVVSLNTPGTRQQYIDNTNLGAVQSNYSDLAQQLAGYDQSVLKPQFEGQNPGQSSDTPAGLFGRTSGVSQLTPESAALPASQGIYNTNPEYGFTAQQMQSDNILSLLSTLNSVMGKERERGTAKHTSDLKSAASVLAGLGDILKMNTDLEMKMADLAESRASRASTRAGSSDSKIARISASLRAAAGVDGYVSPDDYSRIKRQAAEDEGIDPQEFDSQFSGRRNPQNPNYRLEKPSDVENIDEWATAYNDSRGTDTPLSSADIPQDIRAKVVQRALEFQTQNEEDAKRVAEEESKNNPPQPGFVENIMKNLGPGFIKLQTLGRGVGPI